MINVIRVSRLSRNQSKSSSYQRHRRYNFRLRTRSRRANIVNYLLKDTFTVQRYICIYYGLLDSNYEAISLVV